MTGKDVCWLHTSNAAADDNDCSSPVIRLVSRVTHGSLLCQHEVGQGKGLFLDKEGLVRCRPERPPQPFQVGHPVEDAQSTRALANLYLTFSQIANSLFSSQKPMRVYLSSGAPVA